MRLFEAALSYFLLIDLTNKGWLADQARLLLLLLPHRRYERVQHRQQLFYGYGMKKVGAKSKNEKANSMELRLLVGGSTALAFSSERKKIVLGKIM